MGRLHVCFRSTQGLVLVNIKQRHTVANGYLYIWWILSDNDRKQVSKVEASGEPQEPVRKSKVGWKRKEFLQGGFEKDGGQGSVRYLRVERSLVGRPGSPEQTLPHWFSSSFQGRAGIGQV